MRSLLFGLLMLSCLTVAALQASAAESSQSTPRPDQWRYKWHNRQWWYWLPENRWVYWQTDRWNDYLPSSASPRSTARFALRGYRGTQGDLSRTYTDNLAPADFQSQPYYGHAQSDWKLGFSGENEIGPFYGHVVPNQAFGTWGSRGSAVGPFYGHAVSSGD